jgi:hypothetical protein
LPFFALRFRRSWRAGLTTSSPAAGSGVRRHDERSCRRSGAAICSTAVVTVELCLLGILHYTI